MHQDGSIRQEEVADLHLLDDPNVGEPQLVIRPHGLTIQDVHTTPTADETIDVRPLRPHAPAPRGRGLGELTSVTECFTSGAFGVVSRLNLSLAGRHPSLGLVAAPDGAWSLEVRRRWTGRRTSRAPPPWTSPCPRGWSATRTSACRSVWTGTTRTRGCSSRDNPSSGRNLYRPLPTRLSSADTA